MECFGNHYAEKCDKCSKKIGTSEKSYYQDSKSKSGTLCQSCWKSKKNKNNSNSNQDSVEEREKKNNYIPTSSSNLPSQNGNSSNDGTSPTAPTKYDAKCQGCGIEIGVGTHCSSCFEKVSDNKPSSNGGKGKQTWGCGNCQKYFTNKNDLDNHMRDTHGLGRKDENESSQPILKNPLIIGGVILFFTALIVIIIKKFWQKAKRKK